MGKNKKRNKWSNQPRKQQNPLAQQQQMVAPKTCRDYWANNLTEEEQQIFNTPIAVAQHAGVVQRLGYLTATFYHLHSVESLIFGEMQNIVEDWGLLIKGVQPTINSLQQSESKFFKVMHDLVNTQSQGIKETYTQDVDALYDRITRWEGIPKAWKPGDEQKLEGKGRMEDIIGSLKSGTLKLKEQDMEPDPIAEASTLYAIAEMNEDETSTIIKQDITKKGLAAIQANKLAKKNPAKMYVLFEQRMQAQMTCHMTPFKAVQKPADQDELVEIDIKPKGKKPKEKEQNE